MDYEKVLLTDKVVPKHYDLYLTPNLSGENGFRYNGHVDITLDLLDSTMNSITLHAKELEIGKCSIRENSEEGKSQNYVGLSYDFRELAATISFADNLAEGEHTLSIDFVGIHNDQMCGFYRSNYVNSAGEKDIMVSTQLEAIDARRCFPCFDEPALKATFSATLTVPAELTALSNMPIVSQISVAGGKKKVSFEKTPKMSTYLLAFCVGEFDFIESETKTKHGTSLRVYTTPGKTEQGRFALEVGIKSLDLYDSMFGVPFPLPKMDMIAITEFAAGAMENWGLVTYREVDLLLNEKTASGSHKQRVAVVVAHELAHQWFGNLVTMKWWDDLWLNEGFATWMENYCLNELFPEWRKWDQFVVDAQSAAMGMDSMLSSHPVQVPIPNAQQVDEVFDAISYYKGASVIHLVHAQIGHENFIKGLQLYMQKHKLENAETKDLCEAWSEASGQDVFGLVQSWTAQQGFPVVNVAKRTSKKDKTELLLDQKWFLADGSLPEEGKDRKWYIPMFVLTPKGSEHIDLVTEGKSTISVTAKDGDFIKLNHEQFVIARFNYTPEMWQELTAALKSSPEAFADADRAGLVLDCYALLRARMVDPGVLLDLLSAFETETEYVVWDAITTALFGLQSGLSNEPTLSKKFKTFAATLIVPQFKRLGWEAKEDDGHLDKLLRSLMFSCASSVVSDDPEILGEAEARFEDFVKDVNAPGASEILPTDYRSAVLKMLLKQSDTVKAVAVYEKLKSVVDGVKNDAERVSIMGVLGNVNDLDKKREVLDWTTTEVKIQDFFYPINGVSGSGKEGANLAWDYFKENYERITKRIETAGVSILQATIAYSARGLRTAEKAVEVEEFFAARENRAKRTVEQLVEGIKNRANFGELLLSSDKVVEFLEKY